MSTGSNGRGDILDRSRIYIDGSWVESDGAGRIDVIDPATEQLIAVVAEGTAADVDRAVAAARRAFPAWSATPAPDRGKYLARVAEILTERTDELSALMSRDVGMPVEIAKAIQLGLPTFNFGHFAELAASYSFDTGEVGNALIVREPVGVVGAITPWNFPLHQVALKTAAALAAGCTVVVKPSEVAPLGIWALAEILDEIGLPPGVFNLVSGYGPVVGEALTAHPDVDMVSFTGSTRAGKQIAEVAARGVKRVALELGGKSANVILDDADLEKAIGDSFESCFLNSGQSCAALTRMLIPAHRMREAEQIAKHIAEGYVTGDPASSTTTIGPLVNNAQLEKVRDYIRSGQSDGATLVTGGIDNPEAHGYFVAPTVFSGVTREMKIAREEIFGPVLSILPYDTEDEAVDIANDTDFGLAARVWSDDVDRAMAVARRLRAGQVTVNSGAFNPAAPFGGYKQSGLGREGGTIGIEEFLETKAILR